MENTLFKKLREENNKHPIEIKLKSNRKSSNFSF